MEPILFITEEQIRLSNARFDREHPDFLHAGHMRSARMLEGNKVGEVLTDAKIAKYEREGYYSAEYQQARKELWQKKQRRRDGNFDVRPDGTLVYRP